MTLLQSGLPGVARFFFGILLQNLKECPMVY